MGQRRPVLRRPDQPRRRRMAATYGQGAHDFARLLSPWFAFHRPRRVSGGSRAKLSGRRQRILVCHLARGDVGRADPRRVARVLRLGRNPAEPSQRGRRSPLCSALKKECACMPLEATGAPRTKWRCMRRLNLLTALSLVLAACGGGGAGPTGGAGAGGKAAGGAAGGGASGSGGTGGGAGNGPGGAGAGGMAVGGAAGGGSSGRGGNG